MVKKGLRVMYTTPALSQTPEVPRPAHQYGGDKVGLLTGDIIENREGQIMVKDHRGPA